MRETRAAVQLNETPLWVKRVHTGVLLVDGCTLTAGPSDGDIY
jgi:hypothetical protein